MNPVCGSITDLNLPLATVSIRKDVHSKKDHETLIEKTVELLKSGDKEIHLNNQFKNVVLVLGDTGNGKTKFTQWIAGDDTKLIARETEEGTGEYIIDDINSTNSSSITSETVYPKLVLDANIPYYDCPGFNDTRDNSNTIVTAYFIKKVVDFAESVKLVFVINYPSVRKGVDRHNFMKLVTHASEFIKSIEKFENSICLIVTKVDNLYVKQGNSFTLVENNKIVEAVANFLIEVKKDLEIKLQVDATSEERKLYKASIKFISILLVKDSEKNTRIGIFRRPDQPGPLSEISLLQKDKKHVKIMIRNKLTFTEKEHEDFGYTISEKCKNNIHYLVDEINKSVWFSLCRVRDRFRDYYYELVKIIQRTMKSLVSKTSSKVDLYQAKDLSTRLIEGCRRISNLVMDLASVTNPEDLAQKIIAVISDLNIDSPMEDVLNIENKGKYYNFLQTVCDRKLNVRPWVELFREFNIYLSSAKNSLQEDISHVISDIRMKLESDFHQIAKALKNQIDQKTKQLDMKEALKVLNLYNDAMLKSTEKTKLAKGITEFVKIIRYITCDIDIDLPKNNTLSIIHQKTNLAFLKTISEKKINFIPSMWANLVEDVAKYLDESKIWFTFLDDLYSKFSEYEIQKNRQKYNVQNMDDWGKTNKPQGIVITKNNFGKFLGNIAKYNIAEFDKAKNVALTESRLENLNQILELTLKHSLDITYTGTSVFIKADYISISEIAPDLDHRLDNGHNTFLEALKSGVFKFVHIFASKTIFIDQDISFPGIELRIISPKWEIIGSRVISLDGLDGKPHSQSKAEDGVDAGSDGKDGKPGMPGKPGGNFFGIGAFFANGANLTVNVNGGNGGPGQNGGNGQKGKRGIDVGYLTDDDLPNRDGNIKGFCSESLTEPVFSNVTSDVVYRIFGSSGQNGGNGGNGGVGGRGGNTGNVFIFDLNGISGIKVCANQGRNGTHGRSGNGGIGGKNGQDMIAHIRIRSNHLINIVVNAQQMPGWIHQYNVPNEKGVRAPNGKNGRDGTNNTGSQVPEPSNTVLEPFKIINMYKRYAMQHLIYPHKKALLLQFIDLLNGNEEIGSIYGIFGLIDEVLGLEKEYYKQGKLLDFVPFYHSILDRVTEYAKRIESSANSKELTKALIYLYTTALSRIYFLKDKSQTSLIIDLSSYLDIMKKDIEAVQDLQTVFNKISMRSRLKEDYKSLINKRIKEAEYFITKHILPEFSIIGEQIDGKIHLLIEDTIKLQEKSKNQMFSCITNKKELEHSLAMKQVFSTLRFVAKAVRFLGPVGETIGSVIGTATSAAESLMPDYKKIHLEEIPDAIPNLQIMENKLKMFENESVRYFNKLIEEILKEAKDHPDLLQDVRKAIENNQNKKNDESQVKLDYQEIKVLKNELTLEFKRKEQMLECEPMDQKSKTSLQVIHKLKNVVQFSSVMSVIQNESDRVKLEEISKAIERAEKKFESLKLYEEKIYTLITPMLKTVEGYLHDIGNKLNSKSRVILDVTKWQVQMTLRNVQLQIQELTRGFKAESEIVRCVEMLQEVMNNLITIFDRIQHYQDQKLLAEFIADINSDTVCNINISDCELANAMNQLDLAIKSNLILTQYKSALHAFNQWVFPFSENYLEKSMFPLHLEREKTMENLVHIAISHIECMKRKLDLYKTSVMKKDNNLHYGEFNSRNLSTEPFFVWENEKYKSLISKLLSGQEVMLKADIKKSPVDKHVIKFNYIDFQFTCSSKYLQTQLKETLKGYDIRATHMGYSYFRFSGKIYLITSESQTVYYSFEKNSTGEHVRSNAVYNKIKNGDLMLSPYAVWKVRLINSSKKNSFEELERYKNEISIELAGYGSYVTEDDTFNIMDDGYNVIEFYSELDQHLDLADF